MLVVFVYDQQGGVGTISGLPVLLGQRFHCRRTFYVLDGVGLYLELDAKRRTPEHEVRLCEYNLRLFFFRAGSVDLRDFPVPGRRDAHLEERDAGLFLRLGVLAADLSVGLAESPAPRVLVDPSVDLTDPELLPGRQIDGRARKHALGMSQICEPVDDALGPFLVPDIGETVGSDAPDVPEEPHACPPVLFPALIPEISVNAVMGISCDLFEDCHVVRLRRTSTLCRPSPYQNYWTRPSAGWKGPGRTCSRRPASHWSTSSAS